MTPAPDAPVSDVLTLEQRQLLAGYQYSEPWRLHKLLVAFAGDKIPGEPRDGSVTLSADKTGVWTRDDRGYRDHDSAKDGAESGYMADASWYIAAREDQRAHTWPVAWFLGAGTAPIAILTRCTCNDWDAPHQPECPLYEPETAE